MEFRFKTQRSFLCGGISCGAFTPLYMGTSSQDGPGRLVQVSKKYSKSGFIGGILTSRRSPHFDFVFENLTPPRKGMRHEGEGEGSGL